MISPLLESPLAQTRSEGQRDKCHSERTAAYQEIHNSMSVSVVPAVMSLEALLALLCIQTLCQDILDDYKLKENPIIVTNVTKCWKCISFDGINGAFYRCLPEPLLTRVRLLLHMLPCLLLLLFAVADSSSSAAGLLSSSSDSSSPAKKNMVNAA